MTNTLGHLKLSSHIIVSTGFLAILVMVMLFSVPQAEANEYPNILTGQNMTVGSTGQDVVVLQGLMTELGYLKVPTAIPFGYYGALTRDAVAKYQNSINVQPAVGYYGPLTKVAMYNDFASHRWLPILGW